MDDPLIRELSAEEIEESDALGAQMRAADDAARCKCPSPGPDEYTLEIDSGSVTVVHVLCKKQPWFMFEDWHEVICMEPVAVRVEQLTGCSGTYCYGGSCDCGPEVTLVPAKNKEK